MENSRIADIYMHLKNAGYSVYYPGQKIGECLRPYLVVRDEGLSRLQQFSSNMRLYAILVYVPQTQFGSLEPLVTSVTDCMKGLYPMIAPTNFQTPSFLDDTVKAHMISTQYRNVIKQ